MLSDDLLENALAYASLGYAVFPCVPGTKAPLTENGFKNATTDAAQIETWWTENPHANIGLPTDGLVVIDVDGSENAWLKGDARMMELWRGPVGHTPRGGLHHIFRQPAGKTWRNSASEIADNVDTRANGGYILVAPSIVKGASYTWHDDQTLYIQREQIPEPPAWLIELLNDLDRPKTSTPTKDGNDLPERQRNVSLSRLAGVMRRAGMTAAEILAAITQTNRDRCKPPLGQDEVNAIAASISRYEPDQIEVALIEDHYAQNMQAPDRTLFSTAVALSKVHPVLCAPIINGLLREGETMNIIAAPKMGKSWIVLDLALSLATGRDWLGFKTSAGRTLLLDNELHPETFSDRFRRVASSCGLSDEQISDSFCVRMLRGQLEGLDKMESYFNALPENYFKVIILDAFYRFLPKGMNENDNGAMADVYNTIDRVARRLKCAFVLIHHTTKGLQNEKSVTDVGAGGGAQSRAADCHLILRQHKEPNCISVDAVTRSWAPPEPFVIRQEFPLWRRDGSLQPDDLKKQVPKLKDAHVNTAGICGDKKQPAAAMSVEDFVSKFCGEAPRRKEHLVDEAVEAGVAPKTANDLLVRAERKGLIFAWTVARRVSFSTIQQPPAPTANEKRAAILADLRINPQSAAIIADKHNVTRQYVHKLKQELNTPEIP